MCEWRYEYGCERRCWLRSGSRGGVNVDLRFGGNDFTYRNLFHLFIGNCFITCHLLIETAVGCVSKFVSIGYFCDHLVTSALLIELSSMVPFPSVVPLQILRPTFGADAPPPDPDQSRIGSDRC